MRKHVSVRTLKNNLAQVQETRGRQPFRVKPVWEITLIMWLPYCDVYVSSILNLLLINDLTFKLWLIHTIQRHTIYDSLFFNSLIILSNLFAINTFFNCQLKLSSCQYYVFLDVRLFSKCSFTSSLNLNIGT